MTALAHVVAPHRRVAFPGAARSLILRDESLPWTMPGSGRIGSTARLRYRLHGRSDGPLIVVLGGISANRQVQCWWRDLYGSGRAFDPRQVRILSVDWLDQACVSDQAPSTDIQADALAAVLDHLGLPGIDLLVGASFGAMVGLAFAARHPRRIGRLLAISGADRALPSATARRHVQREIIRLGLDCDQPARAVALARSLAMTTYRPDELIDQRFARAEPDQVLDELGAYLAHVGRGFSENFSPERYLQLSEALDRHQVDPRRLRCPVDLVAVDSDQLVPARQLAGLAQRLGSRCRLHRLSSDYGHDAFLKEPAFFNTLIADLTAELTDELIAGRLPNPLASEVAA